MQLGNLGSERDRAVVWGEVEFHQQLRTKVRELGGLGALVVAQIHITVAADW